MQAASCESDLQANASSKLRLDKSVSCELIVNHQSVGCKFCQSYTAF